MYFKTLLVSAIMLLLATVFAACTTEPEPQNQPYALNAPDNFGRYSIPDSNALTEKGVQLGRMLFYDKRLSGDNTQSCASCHQQAKAFTDGNRFSKGIKGLPGTRNTMMLANLLWSENFFWDGRANSLETQVLVPIQDPVEMHQTLAATVQKLQNTPDYPKLFKQAFGSETVTSVNVAKALSQFLRTLISADSKYDRYLKGTYQPTALETKGIQLFYQHPFPEQNIRGGNCGDCHLGALQAGSRVAFDGFHNNGLSTDQDLADGLLSVTGKATDKGKFKAPSLRNIALTAPYMHDGRFNTLEEVLEHYDAHIQNSTTLDPLIIEASNRVRFPGDPVKLYLTPDEKTAILAFLNMLTDETFITNPAYANPFGQ